MVSNLTGHVSQAARVNTLEVTVYRECTLEELQEATDNFSSSNLIKASPLAQVCSNGLTLASTAAWKGNEYTNNSSTVHHK